MKAGIICFTRQGARLCEKLCRLLVQDGVPCTGYVPAKYREESMREAGIEIRQGSGADWAGAMFREGRAMIFIGAAGIALRSTAPWIRDKMEDPPVLVMDEKGKFVIPVLSGHVGGGNELARRISRLTGACPVITTATDVNGLFAPDVFAVRNHLAIQNRTAAKETAQALLEGEPLGWLGDWLPVDSQGRERLPEGFVRQPQRRNLKITVFQEPEESRDLILIPKAVVLGVGCRRGIPGTWLEQRARDFLKARGIYQEAVGWLATIQIKANEPAVRELAKKWGLKLCTYSAEELLAVPGNFSESEFVRKTTGVGNVCQRAAAAAAGGGRLLGEREAGQGITLAAALRPVKLTLDGL